MTNWDDFRFLLAVEQTGSLSAAARQLLVSQPTVSRRIAELEKSLGVVVSERLPDGHRLSTNGVKVCERARAIQQKAEEIAEAVADDRDHNLQQVVISASEGVSATLITPAVKELQNAHPGIVVEVMISNRPVDLRRQEADIAIRLGDPRDDILVGRKIGVVEFGLFAPQSIVDALGTPATEENLSHYPFIESTGEISHLPQANWLRQASPPRMRAYGSNSILNQLVAFNAGLGLLMLPTYLTWSLPHAVRILSDTYTRFIDLQMLYHAPAVDKPGVRQVLDFVAHSVRERLAKGGQAR